MLNMDEKSYHGLFFPKDRTISITTNIIQRAELSKLTHSELIWCVEASKQSEALQQLLPPTYSAITNG